MATAHLLADRFRPSAGLHRSSVSELWHVTDISGWTADNTTNAVFSAVPRTEGQSHPDIGEAICLELFLQQKISNTDAIVGVYFSTSNSETRRFRGSSTRGFTGTVRVPYWTVTGSGPSARWVLHHVMEQREHSLLVETRYVRNGSLTDSARGIMQNLVGSVFRFPDNINGIPYLLKSPSIVDYAPGQSRLIYTFETACRMLEMPAGTIPGQDQTLPPLGFLDEWYAPEGGAATPSPIVVRPWQSRYPLSFHFQLPFLQ